MRKAAGYVDGTQLSRIRNVPETSTNSSGVVGVYFHKNSGKWVSKITFQGKRYYLGRYDTLEKAAQARKKLSLNILMHFSWNTSSHLGSTALFGYTFPQFIHLYEE